MTIRTLTLYTKSTKSTGSTAVALWGLRGQATGEERIPPLGATTAQGRGDGTPGTRPPPEDGHLRRRRLAGGECRSVGGVGRRTSELHIDHRRRGRTAPAQRQRLSRAGPGTHLSRTTASTLQLRPADVGLAFPAACRLGLLQRGPPGRTRRPQSGARRDLDQLQEPRRYRGKQQAGGAVPPLPLEK